MGGGGGGFGVGEEGNKMSILEAEPPAMQVKLGVSYARGNCVLLSNLQISDPIKDNKLICWLHLFPIQN